MLSTKTPESASPSFSSSPSPGAICPHGSRACSLSLTPHLPINSILWFPSTRRWGSADSSQRFVFGPSRGRRSKSHRPAQATTIDDTKRGRRRDAQEKEESQREKAGERRE